MTAKIKLNAASGGGSFSLQAPSSSSNNRVFTLPDSADATILTSTANLGKILQVVSTTKTDTASSSSSSFADLTGINVNIISGKGKALMERLRLEGKNSPADLFITSDAGNLWKIQKEGMFRKILSEKIIGTVPDNARGPNNEWVGIAKRSRVVFYNPNKVKESEIRDLTYEDLASPKWKGRLVVRSSGNIYNQSLVASLISSIGIERTEKWAEGLVKNLARKPQGNDRSQIIAVANGEADIAIANT